MLEVVDSSARIVTDEFEAYVKPAAELSGGHSTVNHSSGQYFNPEGFHTNTVGSYFAFLKRDIRGAFHHVSKTHLHRYCDEFSFRWNGRKISDAERRTLALQQIEGERLMYRQPIGLA